MTLSLLAALALSNLAPSNQAMSNQNLTPPMPYGPIPTAAQVHVAERGFYAFCHFTVDTFTDKEWGDGDEDPKVFNPSAFDANQIVNALKAGGCKAVILTAKHHDGFCLWPTKTTDHNISQSPYQGGHGDIVKEFQIAAHKAGIEFGLYLSPWDRNSAHYGKPEYVTDVYRPQMRELLTQYGPLCEVWMDGANGGTGYYGGAKENRMIDRSTYYDWPTTWAEMTKLQPGAVLFSDVGPGVRWCGNESGYVKDPCWATYTPQSPEAGKEPMPGFVMSDEGMTGQRDGELWQPAEVDVSIRPGWFWHEKENSQVRTPKSLMEVYLHSVGLGATLNLNVPPDRRGILHEKDVASLKAFGDHLRATFTQNLAEGATMKASNVRGHDDKAFGPHRLLSHHIWDAWVTDEEVHTPSVELDLGSAKTFNMVRLREDIRLGQRVEGVALDAWIEGDWKQIATAESIGACRLWRVPSVTTQRVRLRVTKSPVCPALSNFGLFLEPALDK